MHDEKETAASNAAFYMLLLKCDILHRSSEAATRRSLHSPVRNMHVVNHYECQVPN